MLDAPAQIAEADVQAMVRIQEAYPYFVPARYIEAAGLHRREPFSAGMLASIQPYLTDWMMFCDFVNGTPALREQADNRQQKNKKSPGQVIQHMKQAAAPVHPAKPQAEPAVAAPKEHKPIPAAPVAAIIPEPIIVAPTPPMPEPAATAALENIIPAIEENTTPEADVPALAEEPAPPPAASLPAEPAPALNTEDLITPIFANDYFLQQGVKISSDIPEQIDELKTVQSTTEEDKSLMVMMSFSEWLTHFKHTSEKEKAETEDQRALKTMWQREKMAAAIEEETEEIPAEVFEMAVNSITREDGLVSESLAEIYIKQKKYEKAIEMYRKLSLRNPQKNAYFARKIEEVLKEKLS